VSDPLAEEFCLLAGEEHSSASQDAQHWVRVYGELAEFCQLMLGRPELSLENGHLQRRLSHYHTRLEHWHVGLAQSSPGPMDRGEAPTSLDDPHGQGTMELG
jgi:hypothetical protein